MTRAAVTAAVTVGGVAWLAAARRSGVFIGAGARVSARDRPLDELSARKRLIDVDGTNIAYLDEGDGEPLVLLHGCPFSAIEWREAIPRLATQFRVIAPDLLGLGD